MATLTASLANPAIGLNGTLPITEMPITEIPESAGLKNVEKLPVKREEKPPDAKEKDGEAKEKDGDADSGGTDASNAKKAQTRDIK